MANRISRAELKARLDRREPLVLVEALPAKYYLDKHLPGAINILFVRDVEDHTAMPRTT